MSFFIPSSLKILFFKANFTHSLGLKHQQDEQIEKKQKYKCDFSHFFIFYLSILFPVLFPRCISTVWSPL